MMLYLSDNKTRIIEITYLEQHRVFVKNCLKDDFKKFDKELLNKKSLLMVVENLGFVVVKISDKYFDLLGGMRSDNTKNAIKITTPIFLNYCKENNLIFRVQSQYKNVEKIYLEFDGFKSFEKNGMNLIYKRI